MSHSDPHSHSHPHGQSPCTFSFRANLEGIRISISGNRSGSYTGYIKTPCTALEQFFGNQHPELDLPYFNPGKSLWNCLVLYAFKRRKDLAQTFHSVDSGFSYFIPVLLPFV